MTSKPEIGFCWREPSLLSKIRRGPQTLQKQTKLLIFSVLVVSAKDYYLEVLVQAGMATGRCKAWYSVSKNISLFVIDPGGRIHEADVSPPLGNLQGENFTLHIKYVSCNIQV